MMRHKFDIQRTLARAVASKSPLYPGIFIPGLDRTGNIIEAEQFNVPYHRDSSEEMSAEKGAPLRVKGIEDGVYYFMPVKIDGIEMPNAVISARQSKIIIKTDMPESNGSVKEYISLSDMEINVTAILKGEKGNYPSQELERITAMWRKNEALKIVSALTDMLLPPDTKVVLEELTIEAVGEYEDQQVVSLKMCSDEIFELEIE